MIEKGLGRGVDAITQREFHDEVIDKLSRITEVLVAQHAEIEALKQRVERLERG